MKLVPFLIGCVIIFTPFIVAHAAIVPACPVNGCRACDLGVLMQSIIQFLIGISVFIAMLLIAIAGLKSVVSGSGEAAQHLVAPLMMGFVILLGAWLIVDTVMKVLVNQGQFGPWNKIECVDNPPIRDLGVTPLSGAAVGDNTTPGGGTAPGGGTSESGIPGTSASGGPRGTNVPTVVTLADGTQEVRDGGTIAWRNNNPGNMVSGIDGHPSIGSNGGFVVFPSYEAGYEAMIANLQTSRYQATTVGGAIALWAPSLDGNDPVAYAATVQSLTGIPANTPMSSINNREQLVQIANAIQRVEGYTAGTVTRR